MDVAQLGIWGCEWRWASLFRGAAADREVHNVKVTEHRAKLKDDEFWHDHMNGWENWLERRASCSLAGGGGKKKMKPYEAEVKGTKRQRYS